MAFFRVSTNEDQIKDRNDSAYIRESGIYDVILEHALYNKSPNGSEAIDLVINYNGQIQTIWGAIRLTNNNGDAAYNANLFNKLCIVCGGEDGTEIKDPVPVTLPIGKGGESRECMELEDLADIPIGVRIQLEYSIYNEEIRENKAVKNFFRSTDHATAQEIVNNANFGCQYAEEMKTAKQIVYRNDLTKEEVDNWKKERANNRQQDSQKSTQSTFKRHSFSRNTGKENVANNLANTPF